MTNFWRKFRNAWKSCAGVVHAPRLKPLASSRELLRPGRANASARLFARGSVALSRYPVVTEKDMAERKEKMAHYDFEAFK